MKTQTKIRLHRFGDYVAFDCNDTETLYISANLARQFARQLNKIAKSIETENFVDSACGSPVIVDNAKTKRKNQNV